MPKKQPPINTNDAPQLFFVNGGNVIMVGEDMMHNEREYLLRYPAVAKKNPTGTGWTFEPLQLIEPGQPFWLERASLLGRSLMPKIMLSDYAVYLQAMEALANQDKK